MPGKFFLSLLALLFCASAHAASFKAVTIEYPPYEFEQDGVVQGMVTDIVREAFRRLDHDLDIASMPWARALNQVKAGEADLIFTAFKTPEREAFLDYSRVVLFRQVTALYVLKGKDIAYNGDLSNLSGLNFGVVRKFSYGRTFDDAAASGIFRNMFTVDSGEQNAQKLLYGHVDVLVSNRLGIQYILKKLGENGKVKELSPPLDDVPCYVAFSRQKDLSTLRDQFDKVLEGMKQEGFFEKVTAKYLQ